MYLLYLDESGSVSNPADTHFILAGVCILEKQTHWVEQDLNKIIHLGAVIKKSLLMGEDPVEHAFEQLSSRFDLYLKRRHKKHNDTHRGLILFDNSSTEQRIQTLSREFKYSGHRWGTNKNYAEVPVFLDSCASRLIQLADLIAFALFRHFESNDSSHYDIIKDRFDQEGGVQHGLYLMA